MISRIIYIMSNYGNLRKSAFGTIAANSDPIGVVPRTFTPMIQMDHAVMDDLCRSIFLQPVF